MSHTFFQFIFLIFFRGQRSEQPTASNTSGGEGDDSDASKSTSLSKTSLKLDDSQLNETQMSENNKLLLSLMKQISLLHETNSQIMRRLQETKGGYIDSWCTCFFFEKQFYLFITFTVFYFWVNLHSWYFYFFAFFI